MEVNPMREPMAIAIRDTHFKVLNLEEVKLPWEDLGNSGKRKWLLVADAALRVMKEHHNAVESREVS